MEPKFKYELGCAENIKPFCKYGECLNSIHHLVPRRIGAEAISEALQADNPELARLIKKYINHWSNKVLIGRCIHDIFDTMPQPLPDEATMRETIDGQQL